MVFEDGVRAGIALETNNLSVSGEGTLGADVSLSGGAFVAPGDSTGELSITGALSFGPHAVYDWEIEDLDGSPGAGWDLLSVDTEISFDATPDEPWVLRIHDLGDRSFGDSGQWIIASSSEVVGFDPAAALVDTSGLPPAYSSSASNSFSLSVDNGNLILSLSVDPGDFNLDVVVDGADFLAWQRGDSSAPFSTFDLTSWETNFGNASSSTAFHAVPEPTSAVLVFLLLTTLFLDRAVCSRELKTLISRQH
jgi:hypothetical protein